ncbi:RAS1 protein [Balamuthia mandrillaris]
MPKLLLPHKPKEPRQDPSEIQHQKPTESSPRRHRGGSCWSHHSHFGVAVLGPGGVGKSCLTIQMVRGQFVELYDPTIEDSYKQQLQVDKRVVLLEVLDTAGQEEFSSLRDQYIHSAEGFMLVYDITCRSTFEEMTSFYRQILRVKDLPEQIEETQKAKGVPLTLVANKCDMEGWRQVSTEEGRDLAREMGARFVEASARTGENVNEAFAEMIREMRLCRGVPEDGSDPAEEEDKEEQARAIRSRMRRITSVAGIRSPSPSSCLLF